MIRTARLLVVLAIAVAPLVCALPARAADATPELREILAQAIAAAPGAFSTMLGPIDEFDPGAVVRDDLGNTSYVPRITIFAPSPALAGICPDCTLQIQHDQPIAALDRTPDRWRFTMETMLNGVARDRVPDFVRRNFGPAIPPSFRYAGIDRRNGDDIVFHWADPSGTVISFESNVLVGYSRYLNAQVIRTAS